MKKIVKLFKYGITWIFVAFPAFISAMVAKIFIHDLWIVGECGNFARDNGFFFFKYVRDNYPKQKIVFMINKKSPDYNKVKSVGKTCGYKTFGHWFYYYLSSKEITANPHVKPTHFVNKYLWFNKTYFLQHGVIRDFLDVYSANKMRFKLFITSAHKEYEFVLNNFGFSKDVVKLLGLARHDNLLSFDVKQNQILIMPTWREYLSNVSEEEFLNSEYYNCWINILNNKQLLDILDNYNKNIIFYPHREMQKFIHLFKTNNPRMVIANNQEYDIQTLLKESVLLITDYSSVFFDFAYMKKPVIWYLFDSDTYFKQHHKKGYFKEDKKILGELVLDEENLLKKIEDCCARDFALSEKQIEQIEQFFPYFDGKNCERIYNEIRKIK